MKKKSAAMHIVSIFLVVLTVFCLPAACLADSIVLIVDNAPDAYALSSPCELVFSDVPTTYWAYEAVMAGYAHGILVGCGNSCFGPGDATTVAQLAAIIVRLHPADRGTENGTGYWAEPYLQICRDKYSCLIDCGDFSPENYDRSLTRDEAAWMLSSGCGNNIFDSNLINSHGILRTDIPDLEECAPTYQEAVLDLYRMDILHGMDDCMTFGPKKTFTRAEVCQILVNGNVYREGFGRSV